MRTLSLEECGVVGGGNTRQQFVIGLAVNAAYDAAKAIANGFGPTSSSTASWGVVGPGSFDNTNPSSKNSVNGLDSESDNASSQN